MKKIVEVRKVNNSVTRKEVKDDQAARAYEDLPFRDPRVVSVTVTNTKPKR